MRERDHCCADEVVVALVGNPNVGKSTLFNALTGGKQHTGNWAGKTVDIAQGRYTYKGKTYVLVDLPGTYALLSQSEEEQVTAEYILSGEADCTLIISDATCLERNLSFALQVMELTDHVILCINLMDEAESKGMSVNFSKLRQQLGVPVVGISAGKEQGIDTLKETVRNLSDGFLSSAPMRLSEAFGAEEAAVIYGNKAAQIAEDCVEGRKEPVEHWLDRIALGRWSGKFLLLFLLFAVFWLTVVGANYPSTLLQIFFDAAGGYLEQLFSYLPDWLHGLLLDGVYMTTARVVSVMLPPMLIFFPLFSILEDLGYLPRVAFLMDRTFEKCGSCGKQVLTMSMGFGCNAAGVMGCRIIASPKERLLSILTNSLVPCNGRFPALITLAYFIFSNEPFTATVFLTSIVLLSVGVTLLSTKLLSSSVLQGEPSHFVMEMPPYRKPSLKKVLVSAVKNRTLFVLLRAVMVAAPTGALLWVLEHIEIDGRALLSVMSELLDPVGMILGMNGVILLAFILSFPANELLLPLTIMILNGANLSQAGSSAVSSVLHAGGWTRQVALCTMIFVLFHWPCSTTCLAIRKETGSWKWTLWAAALPTLIGAVICLILNACMN